MENKENLSKIKKIYKLYISKDNKIHMEKQNVVYINSEYFYINIGKLLEKNRTDKICDKYCFEDIKDRFEFLKYQTGISFLNIDDFNLNELNEYSLESNLTNRKNELRNKMILSKNSYEKALKKYNNFKKTITDLS